MQAKQRWNFKDLIDAYNDAASAINAHAATDAPDSRVPLLNFE